HVVGLIDFGDMVHSFTVADLAIAIAYAILDRPDPLPAAAAIVRGYHTVRPLVEVEIDALFALVLLRLCASVAVAADQRRPRPGVGPRFERRQPARLRRCARKRASGADGSDRSRADGAGHADRGGALRRGAAARRPQRPSGARSLRSCRHSYPRASSGHRRGAWRPLSRAR